MLAAPRERRSTQQAASKRSPMTQPSVTQDRTNRRAALIVATLASFLGPFMGASVNVALPSMGSDFAMGAVLLSWVNSAYLLAAATLTVPFGRLGDIYGRKKIYIAGVFVYTIASVLTALSTSGMTLIVFRVLQGLGGSMIFATGMAILISVYPAQERGRVLGINVAAVYLGLSSGPFFGGIITEQLGWRFIFWINLPIGLLLLAVIFLMLKGDWAEDQGTRFDIVGSGILGISLLATMYGFSTLPKEYGFYLLGFGLAGVAIFVWFESKLEHPLIDVGLFRYNTVFAFSNLAALINYAATFAVTFLLSLYLQAVRGFTPQQTGSLLVIQPLVQALFSPLAGRLSDRVEPRTVASIGMGLTFAGLVLLVFVSRLISIYYIAGCMVFLGFGFALFVSPNTNAIMGSIDRRMYGVGSAVVGTMRQTGMMFSMGIVMMILALDLGNTEIGPENVDAFIGSMKTSFTVFAALCLGGVFASLARGRVNRTKRGGA
jgi:EmrB/QacA subfamily drug resistance transporter